MFVCISLFSMVLGCFLYCPFAVWKTRGQECANTPVPSQIHVRNDQTKCANPLVRIRFQQPDPSVQPQHLDLVENEYRSHQHHPCGVTQQLALDYGSPSLRNSSFGSCLLIEKGCGEVSHASCMFLCSLIPVLSCVCSHMFAAVICVLSCVCVCVCSHVCAV